MLFQLDTIYIMLNFGLGGLGCYLISCFRGDVGK